MVPSWAAVKRLPTNALIAVAAIVLTLGAAELVMRFVYRDVTTTAPIDSWFGLRWKAEHLTRNSRGLREVEFASEKPPGTRRLLVIGDSFTVAMGIPATDRYTDRLSRALNERGARWQVLQLAHPGQEIHHHLRTLETDALALAPDFLLIQWYPNDFEISKEGRERPRTLLPLYRWHVPLYAHSALYTVLDRRWSVLQVRLGLTQDYVAYLEERFGDAESPESRRALVTLSRVLARAQRAGVPVGMVLFPLLVPQLADDYRLAFLHHRVLAICRRLDVTCVDLRTVYAPLAGDLDRLRVNRFDHHASGFAHQLAADALLEAFGPAWLRP